MRAEDAAASQLSHMDKDSKSQHAQAIRSKPTRRHKSSANKIPAPIHHKPKQSNNGKQKSDKPKIECRNCGGSWPHDTSCPADDQ